jgi:hypothetical protein
MNRAAWRQDRRMKKFLGVLSRWEAGEAEAWKASDMGEYRQKAGAQLGTRRSKVLLGESASSRHSRRKIIIVVHNLG